MMVASSPSFVLLCVELVHHFVLASRSHHRFDDAVAPVQMHAEQHEGH